MKVFFNASLTGKREFGKEYEKIVNYLEKSDFQLLPTPVTKGDPHKVADESADQAAEYYKTLKKTIKKADIAIFEASHPSTGIGHEITVAMELSKPVIVLHTANRSPYVLESIREDRLQVIEYGLNNVGKLLGSALDYASDLQDTRFNFFISPKIANYLDWVSKSKRIPRAVYLRRLIEGAMEEYEEEYLG